MSQTHPSLGPLAIEWDNIAELMRARNESEDEIASTRLWFYAGAKGAINRLFDSEQPAMTLILMRMELRSFDREDAPVHLPLPQLEDVA